MARAVLLSALLLACASSHAPARPTHVVLTAPAVPFQLARTELAGTFNGSKLTCVLEAGDGKVSGSCAYDAVKIDIPLRGIVRADGTLEIHELRGDDPISTILLQRGEGGTLQGTWSNGKHTGPAMLGPKPLATAGCPEPTRGVRLSAADGAAALLADPLAEPATFRQDSGDGDFRIRGRTFVFDNTQGDVIAQDGQRVAWRAHFGSVAGGTFGFFSVAGDRVVGFEYSRGGIVLLDERSGRELAGVGRDVAFSPDGQYALDPPVIGWGTERWEDDTLTKLDLTRWTRTKVARFPVSVGEEADPNTPMLVPSVAICSRSSTFAVSFPTTELAIYRASDVTKLASVPKPGAWSVHFSKSGRLVALVDVSYDKAPPVVFRFE